LRGLQGTCPSETIPDPRLLSVDPLRERAEWETIRTSIRRKRPLGSDAWVCKTAEETRSAIESARGWASAGKDGTGNNMT
jgi:hypothetical protein